MRTEIQLLAQKFPRQFSVDKNIVYGSDFRQLYDVYYPADEWLSPNHPAIIIIPSGDQLEWDNKVRNN